MSSLSEDSVYFLSRQSSPESPVHLPSRHRVPCLDLPVKYIFHFKQHQGRRKNEWENIDSIHVSAQVRESSSLHDQLPCFFTFFSECTLGKPIYRTVWQSWRFSYIESLLLGIHLGATLVHVHKTGTTSSPFVVFQVGQTVSLVDRQKQSLVFRSSSWSRGAILKLGIWFQLSFQAVTLHWERPHANLFCWLFVWYYNIWSLFSNIPDLKKKKTFWKHFPISASQTFYGLSTSTSQSRDHSLICFLFIF